MIDATFEEFDKQFPTDEACKQYIVDKRWPDGVRCPRCNASERIYPRKAKPFSWICKNKGCGERNGYSFSVTTGTIFSDTKVSLRLWFKIGYLMLGAKKGISFATGPPCHLRRAVWHRLAHRVVYLPPMARCDAWRCVLAHWSGRSR